MRGLCTTRHGRHTSHYRFKSRTQSHLYLDSLHMPGTHFRSPMLMTRQGWSASLFQASQQW